MFAAQVAEFSKQYRVIAYDHRGQGSSEVGGPYDMDTVAADAAELIRSLVGGPVHFIGLSMSNLYCGKFSKGSALAEVSSKVKLLTNSG